MIMVKTRVLSYEIHKKYFLILLASCLIALAALVLLAHPGKAAQSETLTDMQNTLTDPVCTPPDDWGQTTRLKVPDKPEKQWSFTVDQPQMVVSLVFFYYQDYSKAGCPYDCSTGECQTDETGQGVSPFGNFSVLDGKEGANRGSMGFEGILSGGTHQVSFTANGNPGSINVGLQVRQQAVPTATETPVPSEVTPTATPLTPEPTIQTPEPQDTATPTPTSRPKKTPPATLAPPTPFPGSPPPQALIPQTGIDLGQAANLVLILVTLGIGVTGIGITFYGIAKRLR
jgi:hypothetical protein